MNWNIQRCLTVALAILPAACAPVSGWERADAPADLGRLQLNESLTIPAHRGWLYVQGGKIYQDSGYISLQGLDQYYPNCRLELRSANADPVVIAPQTFRIVAVRHDRDFVQRFPVKVASLNLRAAAASGPVIMATSFYLESAQQPQVWRLRCAHWEDPWDAQYLTTAQIHKAVGKVFTFTPP